MASTAAAWGTASSYGSTMRAPSARGSWRRRPSRSAAPRRSRRPSSGQRQPRCQALGREGELEGLDQGRLLGVGVHPVEARRRPRAGRRPTAGTAGPAGEQGVDGPQRDHPAAVDGGRALSRRRRRAGRRRSCAGPDARAASAAPTSRACLTWSRRGQGRRPGQHAGAGEEPAAPAGEVGDALEAVGDLRVRAEGGLGRVPGLELDEAEVGGRWRGRGARAVGLGPGAAL